jgi:hypothetical protein
MQDGSAKAYNQFIANGHKSQIKTMRGSIATFDDDDPLQGFEEISFQGGPIGGSQLQAQFIPI